MLDKEYLDVLYEQKFDALKKLEYQKKQQKIPSEDHGNKVTNDLQSMMRQQELTHVRNTFNSAKNAIDLYFKHHNNILC